MSITSIVAVLSILTLILIMSVHKFQEQKEQILVSANLAHELFYALSELLSSSTKVALFLNYQVMPWSNRSSCFHILFPLVIVFPGSGLMALTLAIDRLLSVFMPAKYLKFTRNYAIRMALLGYSFTIPVLLSSVIILSTPYYGDFPIQGICEFSGGTYPIINDIARIVRATATLLGIFIYIPISYKLRTVFHKNSSFKTLSLSQRKQLLRYNIIVSSMVLNEFILIVVPDLILVIWPDVSFRGYLFDVTAVKGLMNVCIIIIMQKELRNYYLSKFFKTKFNQSSAIVFVNSNTK